MGLGAGDLQEKIVGAIVGGLARGSSPGHYKTPCYVRGPGM